MTARLITLLLILALGIVTAAAGPRLFGIGHEGLTMGKLGAAGSKGSNGTGPVTCGTTSGFKFNVACNSQYSTVIHF